MPPQNPLESSSYDQILDPLTYREGYMFSIEDVHKEHAKPTPEIHLFTGASIEWQGYIDDTAPW